SRASAEWRPRVTQRSFGSSTRVIFAGRSVTCGSSTMSGTSWSTPCGRPVTRLKHRVTRLKLQLHHLRNTEAPGSRATGEGSAAAPAGRRNRPRGGGVPEINTGNTAWLLASTALVLLMTPGLALFYGGLNRSKSVLNMMMMSFSCIGLVSVLWLIYGFSLSFGTNANTGLNKWIGSFTQYLGTKTYVSDIWSISGTSTGIPTYVVMAFQMMFAI